MKLSDLNARFVRYEAREPHAEALKLNPLAKVAHWLVPVEKLGEAHGVDFICPKSRAALGPAHAHRVRLWFWGSKVDPEVGKNKLGKMARWRVVSGNTVDTLTLSPGVSENDDHCGWSGAVLKGEAIFNEVNQEKGKKS